MNLRIKYWNSNLPAEMFDHTSKKALNEKWLIIKGMTSIYKNKSTHELTQTNSK